MRTLVQAVAGTLAFLVSTSCSMPSFVMPYDHPFPLARFRGCPPIGGRYRFEINLEDRFPGEFLDRDMALGLMNSANSSDKTLEGYFLGLKGPATVILTIDGDPASGLDVSFAPEDESKIVEKAHLTEGQQYECRDSKLYLTKLRSSGEAHEVGPYSSTSQWSLALATDGALVGHFESSSLTWVWIVFPTTHKTDIWNVVSKITKP